VIDLSGKTALVTGGSRGIGRAIVTRLATQGADVAFTYLGNEAAAKETTAAVQGLGRTGLAIQGDARESEAAEATVKAALEALGKLDILVNNAGIYEFAPLEAITAEHFHKQFNLNVLGLLLTTQEAVKHFGPGGGSIINISSVAALGFPNAAAYSATKAAVNAITVSLAKELGPRKIRVNALNPGMVETEGFHGAGLAESDMRSQIEAQTPLGRIGQPQDIGPAAVFLASSEADWITGETLYISGGLR
jgi:3-oxoacyl-[acyl-carrier protein] reductase